jgi:hypothetical protein
VVDGATVVVGLPDCVDDFVVVVVVGATVVLVPVDGLRLSLIGVEWNVNTDASPTTVPTATIGERLMCAAAA